MPKVGNKKVGYALHASSHDVRAYFNELTVTDDIGRLRINVEKVIMPKVLKLLDYVKDISIRQPKKLILWSSPPYRKGRERTTLIRFSFLLEYPKK